MDEKYLGVTETWSGQPADDFQTVAKCYARLKSLFGRCVFYTNTKKPKKKALITDWQRLRKAL